MNQNTNPPQPEYPPEYDRRGANRAASQWIRDALTKQTEKIDSVSDDVQQIKTILSKTIPDADWDRHHRSHIILESIEEERKRLDEENKKRMEENRQFWSAIKQDIIKWFLRAAAVFIVGIFILGSKAQFKEWVLEASDETVKIENKK
jgi:hypothetical protein